MLIDIGRSWRLSVCGCVWREGKREQKGTKVNNTK